MMTEEEIATTTKECRSLLITCDYKGKESKEIALATLEEIAFNRGIKVGIKMYENRTN
jgi:hypothetical protein